MKNYRKYRTPKRMAQAYIKQHILTSDAEITIREYSQWLEKESEKKPGSKAKAKPKEILMPEPCSCGQQAIVTQIGENVMVSCFFCSISAIAKTKKTAILAWNNGERY